MSLRKNLISNLILTSSNVLFPLITFPYVTRILSNDSYGRTSFIDAFTGYFLTFTFIGIPFYGVREVAKLRNEPEKYSKLVFELGGLQFVLSIFFSGVFLMLTIFVPVLHENASLVRIACITIIATSFSIDWFFQGVEKFSYITSRSLFTKTLNVIAILLLVRAKDDYFIYYLIGVLTIVMNSGWNFVYFLRSFYTRFTERLTISPHIKPLLILFSINVSISIYTGLDTIILGLFTNTSTVSLYTVPLKLVKMYWTVVSGIGIVMIPRVSALFVEDDRDGITELIKKSSSIVFLLTIPFSAFCLAFPDEILFVISGEKYMQAASALRILSPVPLIIGFCNVLGTQYLLPIGREKSILHATIAGLIVSLGLNFSLIPILANVGSSIACIVAESTVCIYIFFAARKRTTVRLDYSLLIQIFISLLVAIPLGFVLKSQLHHFILLAISFTAFLFTFAVLQLIVFKNHFVFSLIKFKRAGMVNPGPEL